MKYYFFLIQSITTICLASAMSLDVTPADGMPFHIGAPIRLQAQVADAPPGTIWYRFSVRDARTAEFRTVRDFSPESSFEWTPLAAEGRYEVVVSARHVDSGDTVDLTTSYRVRSRVIDGNPAISPTQNALVFLYSAPACPLGSTLRVAYTSAGWDVAGTTPPLACTGTSSQNLYIAGLREQTTYKVRQSVTTEDGAVQTGPELMLTTGSAGVTIPAVRALRNEANRSREGVLLQSNVFTFNYATDLSGNLVWYNTSPIRYLTRLEPGGFVVAEYDDWYGDETKQILRVLDLAGGIVAETNAARINELLKARGMRPITSFHHEARMIPGGKLLVLAGNERYVDDLQGDANMPVIGDTILVLDSNLQIEWAWDAFDHLDVRRKAVLNETCAFGTGGCPVFYAAGVANDWLHGNSVQLTPDGHILYSARHQDWILKIDYGNGRGSGNVIWRFGKDGDFTMENNDDQLWFSHQHDAHYEADRNRIVVFDNGNTRHESDPSIHSRGQVWELDENARTAKLVHNFDLGDYARALGSAQRLANGDYHFGLGWDSQDFSQALEFDGAGNLVSQVENEAVTYRSFRLTDIYSQ